MSKSVYQLHDSKFTNVSAYVILKDGNHIANITVKYPKDGEGRLTCFMHILGSEMQYTNISGYGYDKLSHAVCNVANQYQVYLGANNDVKLSDDEISLINILANIETQSGWTDQLYKHDFTKINVI